MSTTKTQTRNAAPAQTQPGREVATTQQAGPPALLDPGLAELARAIDGTARGYARAIQDADGHMERSFLMAQGIQALKAAVTERAMVPIMALMNSPNGFKTDRDGSKNPCYDATVVKDCLITALLHGVYPVGNEWNIIARQCYITANGWKRKLEELPGISDINIAPGTPVTRDGQTLVRVALSWRLDGKFNQLLNEKGEPGRVFPIQGAGSVDNVLGKAKAKAYRAAYEKATGSVCTLEEGEVADPGQGSGGNGLAATGQSRTQEVLGRLQGPSGHAQQIQAALADLGMDEPEWLEVAETLKVPANTAQMTAEQAKRTLEYLQGEKARLDAEDQAESEATRANPR